MRMCGGRRSYMSCLFIIPFHFTSRFAGTLWQLSWSRGIGRRVGMYGARRSPSRRRTRRTRSKGRARANSKIGRRRHRISHRPTPLIPPRAIPPPQQIPAYRLALDSPGQRSRNGPHVARARHVCLSHRGQGVPEGDGGRSGGADGGAGSKDSRAGREGGQAGEGGGEKEGRVGGEGEEEAAGRVLCQAEGGEG